MNILIINASPKKKGGDTRWFSKILKCFLSGNKVTVYDVCSTDRIPAALELMKHTDAVVFSAPLYVDAVPGHFVEFLIQAENFCKKENIHFILYAISNSGFVEGIQNKIQLDIYEDWCERAGIKWGGGLGIGGGVMLGGTKILLPVFFAVGAVQISMLCITKSATAAGIVQSMTGFFIILFFHAGSFYGEAKLARIIKKGKCNRNHYVRVLVPSFLFIPLSDTYMALRKIMHK